MAADVIVNIRICENMGIVARYSEGARLKSSHCQKSLSCSK